MSEKLYVVMKHTESGRVKKVVCAFWDEEKAEKKVAELMGSRTEICWYTWEAVEIHG